LGPGFAIARREGGTGR